MLVVKARQLHLEKRAIFGAAVSALAQNLVGMPIAKSKAFKKSLGTSAATGALGKKAPRTATSLATDAVTGVIAPEVNIAKNEAYKSGSKYKAILNKMIGSDRRKAVVARLAAAGDSTGLKRIGKSDSKLARNIRSIKDRHGIPDIPKKDISNITRLPNGVRPPSSTAAAIAGNALITPLPGGASTAAVNVGKMTMSTNKVSNSKVGKMLNEKFVSKPLKESYTNGVSGGVFNKAKHVRDSILLNPFTSEAERLAHKAGKVVKDKVQ